MTSFLFVIEINCWEPVLKPNAKMLWDGTSRVGSVVYYQCAEGYYTRSLRNYSVCGENGLWEDIDLWCEGADYYIMHVQGLLLLLLWKKRHVSWRIGQCVCLVACLYSPQSVLIHVCVSDRNKLWSPSSPPPH